MAELMMNFPQTLGMVMFPRLAGSDLARGHAMTAVACRQTLAMTLACAVVLILLGKFLLVLWYGAAYAPAAAPLAYVAGGIISMSLYVLLSRNFTSRNRQFVNIFAAYVALIGNLTLNVVLIPRQGIIGAALATLVSYTIATSILLVLFLRESKLPWHEVLVLKPGDIALWKQMAEHAWQGVRRRMPARA
jgi:O-antigen/teichoic acid export membrane protein